MRWMILWMFLATPLPGQAQSVADWSQEFPKGDFSKHTVPIDEFRFDGNTRDSIPPVENPVYVRADSFYGMHPSEPVISVVVGTDARAYPLEILLWHEIVNEVIGGEPLLITYCPLCNSGVVFSREINDLELTFGNTGRIRHLDMVMYDHQTESWWQQFSGRAIVGSLSGERLTRKHSVVESLGRFREKNKDGVILVPENPGAREYGRTPFRGMENRSAPRLSQRYPTPKGIRALDYVIVVDDKAWPLNRLMQNPEISENGVRIKWTAGRNSLHDDLIIANGRDIGMVEVRSAENGKPLVHDVVFAFAFSAFVPDGTWMLGEF